MRYDNAQHLANGTQDLLVGGETDPTASLATANG
jgi:hypothetical protein